MRKFVNCMLFSLLAVGWTVCAQAQRLPAESLSKRLVTVASKPHEAESMGFSKAHALGMTDLSFTTPVRAKAPLRAGVDLQMKSITKADADAITYTWDNGDGQGPRTSKSTDVAKDPYQMYELLREVYTNQDFPGPYYSAFTMNDQRERKVYYGAIQGGWEIDGNILPPPTPTTQTITDAVIVANGTSTNYSIPVQGYYQDYGYRDQMIYTATQLGLQSGDKITSLTFYPTAGIKFYGSSIKLSLGHTNNNSFNSTSMITSGLTQVATLALTATNTSATEWTFTFDQPFTYNGGNLIVQVQCQGYRHDGTSGQYDNSSNRTYFYGQTQSANQSLYAYGTSTTSGQNNTTGTLNTFLPKTKFDYERTVTVDPTTYVGDINITASSFYTFFRDITVYDENNNILTSWNYNGSYGSFVSGGNTNEYYNLPTGWDANGRYFFRIDITNSNTGTTYYYGALSSGDEPATITIPSYLFAGHSRVRLVINATDLDDNQTITVNNFNPTAVEVGTFTGDTYEWTINAESHPYTEYDPDYYLPNEEGYTALIVAVNDTVTLEPDEVGFDQLSTFTSKEQIIEYFRNNVDSIQLLTDGMRIGEANDYSIGTVFKCDGTYNKFFFLGKGQARQKADVVRSREINSNHLLGEAVPFKYMFEQFSPTSGESGSDIQNFYSKMMEGNVYPVVHDCASVIQNGHQFSMSGNKGITPYAMTGMNFFIPDYRLKYWTDQYYVKVRDNEDEEGNPTFILNGPYNVDGRIMNPYMTESVDGNPALNESLIFDTPSSWVAWYAQYNMLYPPKVGLYKITLEAVAEPVADVHEEDNRNYKVTLAWVSSLNEMTGHDVPQTYTVYYWDPETGEKGYLVVEGYTTVNGETGETTLVYYVEQKPHSYKIDYIVEGRPEDSEHQQFVAESNLASVIIPGWDDFVGLELDHHESDFESGDMANWYRNFLTIVNEDLFNGLTIDEVSQGMRQFNLYRWSVKNKVNQPEEKIATITFDQVTPDSVHYVINYLPGQEILESPKYDRATMDILDQGWIRVKGNGDLVIWPNGYYVNFKSIIIKDGNTVLYSWDAEDADIETGNANLPSGWRTSPGSKMVPYIVTSSDQKVCYMEGGGYIFIPNMVGPNSSYSNLTVEIVAYTDGAHVGRIEVNDKSQSLTNVSTTYTWGDNNNPISPAAAPKHDGNGNNSMLKSTSNTKSEGLRMDAHSNTTNNSNN